MPFDLGRIGQLLRSAREEKGLTYEEVAVALFIRKRVIEAIEAGNWEALPHPVYVRGYVGQYASFLKIEDAVEAVMIPAVPEATQVHEEEAVSAPRSERKKSAWRLWEPRKKVVGAATMGAAVVGFFVFQNLPKPAYIAQVVQPSATAYQTTAAAPPVTAPSAELETGTSPYKAIEASVSEPVDVSANQTAGGASFDRQEEKIVLETKKLTIACQERTWVRIIIDGTEKKEFMLNPEEVVMLNARDGFDLLIGNAAGVKLIYNGKDVGLTGQAGEVKHINLS